MVKAAIKFSALDLCYRDEYTAAAECLGLRPGERPKNASEGDSEQAEAILVAGIILAATAGIQQQGDQVSARELLLESVCVDPRLSPEARMWTAWSYQWDGNFAEALAICETVLAEASLTSRLRFRTLLLKVISCCHLDRLDQGCQTLREMETIYDTQDNLLKGKFHLQRGRVLSLKKQTDRAIVEYDCAINFFHMAGDVRCEAVASQNLAGIYCDVDHNVEAHEYAERARALFEKLGDTTYLAKTLDVVAQIYLNEGKLSEAQSVISHALELIKYEGQALNECLETSAKIKQLMATQGSDDHDKLRSTPITSSIGSHIEQRELSEQVMTPLQCATHILRHPEYAAALYTFFVWATTGNGNPLHDAEREHIESLILAKTPQGERFRESQRDVCLQRLESMSDSESD